MHRLSPVIAGWYAVRPCCPLRCDSFPSPPRPLIVAHLADLGQPFRREAAMAKLYASEAAARATTKAVQIHGGYGTDQGVSRRALLSRR
jgi:alkylation response protein AidB-like acyl-CoA dehydrogenase